MTAITLWSNRRKLQPDFFFIAGPGEIYQGAVARQKHFAWADIPSALVQKWEGARRRAGQHRIHHMDIHAPRCLNMGGDIIVKERS